MVGFLMRSMEHQIWCISWLLHVAYNEEGKKGYARGLGVHVRFMDGLGGSLHPVSAVLPEIFETCAELAATEGHGTMLGPVHSASL